MQPQALLLASNCNISTQSEKTSCHVARLHVQQLFSDGTDVSNGTHVLMSGLLARIACPIRLLQLQVVMTCCVDDNGMSVTVHRVMQVIQVKDFQHQGRHKRPHLPLW